MKKFDDELRTAVFTTKFILSDGLPILHVFHHLEDGAWEFIGDQKAKEKDYKVISLEEIIKIDSSVLEIADLPYGKSAYRESKDSPWEIR